MFLSVFASYVSDMTSSESEGCQINEEDDDIKTVSYNTWEELFEQISDICLKGSEIGPEPTGI